MFIVVVNSFDDAFYYDFAVYMDHSVIGVFCYNGGSISIRIGLDSSIGGVIQELLEKWLELGLKCYNMCFNRDEKDNLIKSDGELHSLACYYFAKKIAIVEIRVVVCVTLLITSSGSISASSSSSSSSSVSGGGGGGGGVVVVRNPFKSNFWARNFDGGVGQRFALGAPEFHCKLIEYSIVSGYKYELIKNDEARDDFSSAMVELPSGSGDMVLRSWQIFDVGSTSEVV
ncbi:hypothetical protein IFM89_038293 [Coptis chinensis]|uniref:Uncharacterized protein n=1 Tax=Coptis chinensis TaxID=261450 RepID=A0A835H1B5_9MAGN|nr:hypothetical protein IFM89_038293 [Coptis chinensis]